MKLWKGLSDHQRENLRLLRLCALCGKMGDDPIATWKSKIKWYSEKQSLQGYESNWRHADGVRVESIPRNHVVGPPREDSKSNERPTAWTWAFTDRIIFVSMHNDIERWAWQIMESISRKCDGKFLKIRSSNISCHQCLWERTIRKQSRRQEVDTLQW